VPAESLSAGLQTIFTGATRPCRKRGPDQAIFKSPLDLFAIANAAFVARAIAADGETTWHEGFLPIGVHVC
jgi:hypothetical protein